MIKPCPLSILIEKEPQNLAQPFFIEEPVYFFKDEDGIPAVIFKLNSKYDDKDFIHDQNEKIFLGKKYLFNIQFTKFLFD
jgi:hypothetical protein